MSKKPGMRKKDVFWLFGGAMNTALVLDISPQAVYKWPNELPVRAERRVRKALRDWLEAQGPAR